MENNETKINEEMRELTEEELRQVSGGHEISGDLVPGTSGKDAGYNYTIPKPYID